MDITYKNKRIMKVCTDAKSAEKYYGKDMSNKIHQRIDEITAADSVEMLIQYKIGGCHILKGDRKKQYAMVLIHPYRLVFEMKGSEIQIVRIIAIIDYH